MRAEMLLKPEHCRQFLCVMRAGGGHGLRLRPHDQSRQRELVPGKARAGILFGQWLDIAVPQHAIRPHAMPALDITHQFDHLLDLLLRILRVGRVRIAAVA
jgi:hypothetical protein